MSEIVKIDIDKPIAFVHFTLRAADDIDGAPGCIPKAIYAVQDRFLQLLQVPAMEFDSVFVMDLSVFQLIKCTEAVFCNKQRFLPPVPEYVQIVPQADRVDSPIVSGPFQKRIVTGAAFCAGNGGAVIAKCKEIKRVFLEQRKIGCLRLDADPTLCKEALGIAGILPAEKNVAEEELVIWLRWTAAMASSGLQVAP